MSSLSLDARTLPSGAIRNPALRNPALRNPALRNPALRNPALRGNMDYYINQTTRDLIIYLSEDPGTDIDVWGTESCSRGLYLVPASERDETTRILKSFRLVETFRPEKRSWDESYGGVSMIIPYAVYAPYSTVYPDIFH